MRTSRALLEDVHSLIFPIYGRVFLSTPREAAEFPFGIPKQKIPEGMDHIDPFLDAELCAKWNMGDNDRRIIRDFRVNPIDTLLNTPDGILRHGNVPLQNQFLDATKGYDVRYGSTYRFYAQDGTRGEAYLLNKYEIPDLTRRLLRGEFGEVQKIFKKGFQERFTRKFFKKGFSRKVFQERLLKKD